MMPVKDNIVTARIVRAVCVFGGLLLSIQLAQAGSAAPAHKSSPEGSNKASARSAIQASKPLWAELNPQQQQILSPLANEWDKLDGIRKKKWLELASRYPKMKPDEQQRIQSRMRDWAKLTPEQRRMARESYARAKKLDAQQKSAEWNRYQSLPEEQKKKLAAEAEKKKRVANLPRHATPAKPPVVRQSPVAKQSPIPAPAPAAPLPSPAPVAPAPETPSSKPE